MKPIKLLAFCLLVLSAGETAAQSVKPLEEINTRYQSCLDTGVDMSGCSKRHFQQIDSLLHVTYRYLKSGLGATEKETLKKEQLAWLEERKNFFRQENAILQKKSEAGEGGLDLAMISYDSKADFLRERLLVLLNWTKEHHLNKDHK